MTFHAISKGARFQSLFRQITARSPSQRVRCLAGLSASQLRVELNPSPKVKPECPESVAFGSVFTDHMLTIEWDCEHGFHPPLICPFGNLSLHPAVTSLQYSLQLFEGMKAYRCASTGGVNMFRPLKNFARLNRSAQRIALPPVDPNELLKCVAQLLHIDQDWVPNSRRAALYMRPTYISVQPTLGIAPPQKALLYVILSPVGPYFKTGTFNPVRLFADPFYIRAWEGGTGNYKVGGNYGVTIGVQKMAEEENCQQVLWLYGPSHLLTEVGAMNIFMLWTNQLGEKELVTPILDTLILPGVTRESILALTRSWGEFPVVEKNITMPEVYQAVLDGRLHEMFGAGTAAVVCPVKAIHYKRSHNESLEIDVPFCEHTSIARRVYDQLTGIQYGEIHSDWTVSVEDVLSQSGGSVLSETS